MHRFGDGWYPQSGALHETGAGDAAGRTVNIPFTENGLGDTDYLATLELLVLPILSSFAPDVLLISAGFE